MPGTVRGKTPDAREMLLCASHDLRSPFAAIRLSAEGLERRWRNGEPISGTEWASAMIRIRKAADGALRLMEDLLSVERLRERDVPRVSKRTPAALVDVTEVISDAISLQREHLDRAGCEVRVRSGEGLTARGQWERGSLLRIFSNLLQNSSRYAPGAPIDITLFRRETRLGIRFADHGPGFTGTRDFTARVLGSGPTTRHGMGLWIVRRAVAGLGGRLALASDPGSGTTFTIEIPGLLREGHLRSTSLRPADQRRDGSRLRRPGNQPR